MRDVGPSRAGEVGAAHRHWGTGHVLRGSSSPHLERAVEVGVVMEVALLFGAAEGLQVLPQPAGRDQGTWTTLPRRHKASSRGHSHAAASLPSGCTACGSARCPVCPENKCTCPWELPRTRGHLRSPAAGPHQARSFPCPAHYRPSQSHSMPCPCPACPGTAHLAAAFPILLLSPQQAVVIGKVNQGVVIDLVG